MDKLNEPKIAVLSRVTVWGESLDWVGVLRGVEVAIWGSELILGYITVCA